MFFVRKKHSCSPFELPDPIAEKVVVAMIFLSTLLRAGVFDRTYTRVGVLSDLCISLRETFPVITALVVQSGQSSRQPMIIPWSQVRTIEEKPLLLNVDASDITVYQPREDELLLKRDLLDKQIVDTQGFRVVKVNDLKLAQIKRTARLIGVDISFSGLMRRLGLLTIASAVSQVLPVQPTERTITWNYVEPIEMVTTGATGQLAAVGAGGSISAAAPVGARGSIPYVQLNVSHTKLADLRPADIADILEQLDLEEAGAMLKRLDTITAADTLSEVEYPRQAELLSELHPELASDLLERLAPDDAADILADLPQQEAEHLLNLMAAAESQPIRDLLRYASETAGGIMTNEVLALPQQATVEDALAYMRQHSAHLEMLYYLYVVDEEHHLVGVVSLRQLVTASPDTQMHSLMNHDVIKVQVDTDQEEVARIIAKYDLLAVPVVDAENRLCGMITVDDAIDVIHAEQAEDVSEMTGTDVEESHEEEGFSLRTAFSRFTWQALNAAVGFLLALLITQLFQPLLFARPALAMHMIPGFAGALAAGSLANAAPGTLLCLIPMLLLTAGSIGSQALAVAGWELRNKRGRDFLRVLGRELLHGTMGGILTSILVALLCLALFHSLPLSLAVGLGTGGTLLVAALCGMILPNVLQRLRLRGSWLSAPLLDPVIAAISLVVFLPLTLTLLAQVGL
jgi:magnesium transporter